MMDRSRVFCRLCGLIVVTGLAGGCADVRPTHSGYLSDYSAVKSEGQTSNLLARRATTQAAEEVDSFYIDEIAWRATKAKRENSEPSRRDPIVNTLRESLRKELGKVHPVVDLPGSKTAHVRAAVTEVVDANLVYNVALTIIAVPLCNGGVTVEAEVMAPDGKQMAAVDYSWAGPWYDIFGYYIPQAHAIEGVKHAAKELKLALSQQAGKK